MFEDLGLFLVKSTYHIYSIFLRPHEQTEFKQHTTFPIQSIQINPTLKVVIENETTHFVEFNLVT